MQKIFISHKFLSPDMEAARKLANRLKIISEEIDIFLASDPDFEGPRIGRSINESLRSVLGQVSLVILIYSDTEHDWGWCMWECGVATDPNDETPTNVVILSLRGRVPRQYQNYLIVDATKEESIQNFVKQLCTDETFFPNVEHALTNRNPNDVFIKEQAQLLSQELKPYTVISEREEVQRWGGISLYVGSSTIQKLKNLKSSPLEAQDQDINLINELNQLTENMVVTKSVGWGLSHFDYEGAPPDITLADLRKRWEESRGENRLQNKPWTLIILDEIWRIVTSRPTKLTWDPFLSMRDGGRGGLWVYPIIYRYTSHSEGHYEFDLLIIQTLEPGTPLPFGVDSHDIKEEGRREGKVTLILRLINRRLGHVPQTIEKQVRQLPIELLENLGEALLDFDSESDLSNWLSHR